MSVPLVDNPSPVSYTHLISSLQIDVHNVGLIRSIIILVILNVVCVIIIIIVVAVIIWWIGAVSLVAIVVVRCV